MTYHAQGINAVQNTTSADAAGALANMAPPSQNCSTATGYTQNNKETEQNGHGNGSKYFDRDESEKGLEEQEALKRSIKHYSREEQYKNFDLLTGALGAYGFVSVRQKG